MRCRFRYGYPGVRAYEMLGEMPDFRRLHVKDGKGPFPEVQCRHHGVPDALLVSGFRLQLVHDEFYEVGLVSVQEGDFVQVLYLRVYPRLRVAASFQLVEQFPVVAFPSFHERGEEYALAPCVVLHYERDYLFVGISDHLLPGGRGVGLGCPGVEQSEEIIDFGDCAYGRPRVVAGGLLLYRYYRAESRDALHFRFPEDADELFRVCREGVHVPSLAFGIYGCRRRARICRFRSGP